MKRKRNKYIDASGQRMKMHARYKWPFEDFVDTGTVRWEPKYGHVFAPDRYAGTTQVFSIPFERIDATDLDRQVWQCRLHRIDEKESEDSIK